MAERKNSSIKAGFNIFNSEDERFFSHDIKTPLSVLGGALTLLETDLKENSILSQEIKESTDMMARGISSLNEMLNGYLFVKMLNNVKKGRKKTRFSPANILNEVIYECDSICITDPPLWNINCRIPATVNYYLDLLKICLCSTATALWRLSISKGPEMFVKSTGKNIHITGIAGTEKAPETEKLSRRFYIQSDRILNSKWDYGFRVISGITETLGGKFSLKSMDNKIKADITLPWIHKWIS